MKVLHFQSKGFKTLEHEFDVTDMFVQVQSYLFDICIINNVSAEI